MTEKSYFWDGTVRGDAKYAPYTIDTFTRYINNLTSLDSAYVIPLLENELAVSGAGTATISVATGYAIANGYIYYNSAVVSLTVAPNGSSKPRMDRVVLRLDRTTETFSLAILTGTPSTELELPVCRDIAGSILEVPLAYYYIGAGETTVTAARVIDERKFYNTPLHSMTYPLQNIMPNSEFMGYSNIDSGTLPPDMWTVSGVPTFYNATKSDYQTRGRSIRITGTTSAGMTIVVDTGSISTMYTLSIPVHVASGVCWINFAGVNKYIYPTNNPVIFTFRAATSGYQTLGIKNLLPDGDFTIGQITMTQGYIAAPFSPKSEFVPFNTPAISLTYNAAISSGTTTPATGAEFNDAMFLPGIRGFLTELTVYDSGSSGAGPYYLAIQDVDTSGTLLRIDCAGLPNSTKQAKQGIISMKVNPLGGLIPASGYEYQFKVVCAASGAGTMTVKLAILGILI